MPVELVKGALMLSGSGLFFDARRRSELSFVSHAHTDHIARHQKVVATRETLTLMQHRVGQVDEAISAPYFTPFEVGKLRLELFPAGHVLGSAQVRVTRQDGHRVVYTGDLNLGPALTATPTQVATCDTLIIESTFGNPRFRFPPKAEVYDTVADWATRHLARGVRPILYAYSLGKSQEAIKQLAVRGLPVVAHPSIHEITMLYRALGVDIEARRYDDTFRAGEVGIFPPFGRSHSMRSMTGKSTAVLTGWALERWAARRYGADVAFPVSDHADFPALIEYAQATGAREVITMHGFAEDLATALKKRGTFARAVTEKVQMSLPFG